MKKSGIAAIAAGVVILGGGAWAATTLPASDDGEVAAVEETPTPAPTVEPSVTPTPEATPTPEVTYSEDEQIFLDWARPNVEFYDVELSDPELLSYLAEACVAEADRAQSEPDPVVFPAELDDPYGNVNLVFMSAARNGYGPGINGEAGSYCD